MVFKGDIACASIGEVLQMLFQNEKEGTLRILGYDQVKSICCSRKGITLLNPKILDAQYFSDLVVSAGLAEEDAVVKTLKEIKPDQPVHKAFINAGVLDKNTATQLLALHMEEEIYSLFDLTFGKFEFYRCKDSESLCQKSGLPLIPIESLLIESARRQDELKYLSKYIEDLNTIFVKNPASDKEIDKGLLDILELVDGQRTVRQIADGLLLSPLKVAREMIGLFKRKSIRPLDDEEFQVMVEDLLKESKSENISVVLKKLKPNLKKIVCKDVDVSTLADLYLNEGDQQTATDILLEKAAWTKSNQPDETGNPMLEHAKRISPEDTRVLSELTEICKNEKNEEVRLQNLFVLARLYLKTEQFDESLKACGEILSMDLGGTFLMENTGLIRPESEDAHSASKALEKYVIDHIPDFLMEADHKQGAIHFLESIIHDLGRKWDPEKVAQVYHAVMEAKVAQETVRN